MPIDEIHELYPNAKFNLSKKHTLQSGVLLALFGSFAYLSNFFV